MPFNPQGAGAKDRQYKKGATSAEHPYPHILYPNIVIAEVELDGDYNFEKEFKATAEYNKDGSININKSGLREIPKGGFYYYTTNTNLRDEPGNWLISGGLKVNRILTQKEANDTLIANGLHPQLRVGGDLNLESLGFNPNVKQDYNKLLDPVTYDDNGDVIPLSERFNLGKADVRYSNPSANKVANSFRTPLEAVSHLTAVLGVGINTLVNNGVLVFGHGKAQWEEAIRNSRAPQAWIDAELANLAKHPFAEEMTLNGKVYFDLDAIDKDRLAPVAIHSIGEHFHLEKMLGAENYANLLNQIANRAKVKGSIEEKVWNQTAKNYDNLEVGSRAFVSEVIAKLGEVAPNLPWYKRLLATVKAYLTRMGFGPMVRQLTGTDMNALLLSSLRHAAYGASKEAVFGESRVPQYSLAANQMPTAVNLAGTPQAQNSILRKVADSLDRNMPDTAIARAVREAVESPQRMTTDMAMFAYDSKKALDSWFKKAEKAIAGLKDDETSNPWLAAKTYESYVMLLNREFDVMEREPFLQKMGDKGIKQHDLDDYMWARSAADRNAKIAAINPKYPDGGSGLTNAEAADILAGNSVTLFAGTPDEKVIEFADPQQRADMEELSVMKDAIVHKTIDLAVEHGILPLHVGEQWKIEEPYYSPLFRVLEGEDFFVGAGSGTGYDMRGRVSRHAIGSGKPVANVLANVFDLRQKVIRMGAKASVGHAAFNLALQAPSPGYYFAVDPIANKIQYTDPKFPDPADPQSASRYNKAYAKLESVIGQPLFQQLEAIAPQDANGFASLGHIRLMYRMLNQRYYQNGELRRALSMVEMQEAMEALPVSFNGVPVKVPNGTGGEKLLTTAEIHLAPPGSMPMLPGVFQGGQERFAKLVTQTLDLGMSPAEVMGYVNEIATPIVKGTGANKRVVYVVNPSLRNRPNVFATEVNGETKFIFFNERNKDAMQIARALKNLDAPQLGWVWQKVAFMTRLFASLNTQYSLFFGPFNLMRDLHMAYLTTKHLPFSNYRQLVSYAKTSMAMFHPQFGALIRAEREGRAFVPRNPEEASMYATWDAAKQAGMPVGFTAMFGAPSERKVAIDKEIRKLQIMSHAKGPWEQLVRNKDIFFRWVSENNESMELAMRLAIFKQATDSGLYSPARAAAIAKDSTVDFNQKGTVAPQLGALYAFFNASIGSTANVMKALSGPAGRQIITGGLILGALQAIMMAAADFDDDDPPESTRQKNFIIPVGGGRWVAYPYPLGFHVLVNLSRMPMQAIMSKNKGQGAKVAFDMLSLLAEGSSPIGSGTVMQTITPTAFDPITAVWENKDWQGRSIYREDFNALDPTPAYTRAKSGAFWPLVKVAQGINWVTGGNQYVPGMTNLSPDALEYALTQWAGAPARDVTRAGKWITGMYTGDFPPMYTVPLVGRMTGKTHQEAGESAVFYRNVAALNRHEREIDGLMKDNPSAVPAYLSKHPEAALMKKADTLYRKIGELHRKKRDLLDAGASKAEVKKMGDETVKMMTDFNNKVDGLMK
jgi:hypothetical protein